MKKILFGKFARDSVFTMIGLVAMNGVAQFVVYPFLREIFGAEDYGKILSMLGVVNIIAVSVGTSLNNARLVAKTKGIGKDNKPYNIFLLIVTFVGLLLSFGVFAFLKETITISSLLLYWALMTMTIIRYYSDVEYRLNTNYSGLLIYYLVISVGYLVGMLLVKGTGCWAFGLLTGEVAGFAFVSLKGALYRKSPQINDQSVGDLWKSGRYLVVAQLLVNIIFNSDRIILMAFCSGSAVTVFYIASAVGKMISFVTASFNSVIIGYLAKKEESLSLKFFYKIVIASVVGVFAVSGLCYLGSIIYTKLLYPEDFIQTQQYFYPANLAQIFFFVSGIFTTILLRYEKEKMQTIINIFYVAVFCGVAIGLTYKFGVWGYIIGILISNFLRYVISILLCAKALKKRSVSNVYFPEN